jgi:uncharacterized membrane protein (DUF106 family)
MNKLEAFLSKHGIKAIIILLLLTYFKSCSVDSEVTKVKKELRATQVEINQIDSAISELPTALDVQIEALKAEKRMIQATNRKMLDVQRQNEIEKEIDALEKIK